MNPWKIMKRVVPLLMLLPLLAACSFTGAEPGPLDPRGEVGREQLSLINLSVGVMFFVLIVVFVLFFFVIIRFRRRKGDDGIPVQVEGNHKLEIIWTVIPIILLAILAVPTVASTFNQATDYTDDPDALLVKVTGHQFWWEFEYPEQGIYTAQDLVIPVNTKVQFHLNASDVLHSFWIPALGGKIDTIPGNGNINKFYLASDETGVFRGKCAELCGASHALMDFKTVVLTDEDFEAWVSHMKQPAAAVSGDAATGQELFKASCIACHAVDASSWSSGPNLTGFASRETIAGYLSWTDDNLFNWIDDPQEVKQGTKMPDVPLSDDDIRLIVEYLKTLK